MTCKFLLLGDKPVKSIGTSGYDVLIALVKEYRLDARVTQRELCEKLGQDVAYISKVERGVRRLDLIEFCDIVAALGQDPKEAFATFLTRRNQN